MLVSRPESSQECTTQATMPKRDDRHAVKGPLAGGVAKSHPSSSPYPLTRPAAAHIAQISLMLPRVPCIPQLTLFTGPTCSLCEVCHRSSLPSSATF